MIIKKFKNGKIKLELETNDKCFYYGDELEVNFDVIYGCMQMADLYIIQIDGYQCLVDYNTQKGYELESYFTQNPLQWFLNTLNENNKIYLHPLSKKQSKDLIQDIEKGY